MAELRCHSLPRSRHIQRLRQYGSVSQAMYLPTFARIQPPLGESDNANKPENIDERQAEGDRMECVVERGVPCNFPSLTISGTLIVGLPRTIHAKFSCS